jgi:hypothetical protein
MRGEWIVGLVALSRLRGEDLRSLLVFLPGNTYPYPEEDIEEWGQKIERPSEEEDAEYLLNYVDPLRDPDRIWNV